MKFDFVKIVLVVISLLSIWIGGSGVIYRELSSGEGSWAKAPWVAKGGDAVVLGVVMVAFGFYIIYLLFKFRK